MVGDPETFDPGNRQFELHIRRSAVEQEEQRKRKQEGETGKNERKIANGLRALLRCKQQNQSAKGREECDDG